MYEYYKAARDMAWEALIECNIKSLPIDLHVVAKHYGIEVASYSKCGISKVFNLETISGDGFITEINMRKTIFLNDKIKTRARRRFTMGHELGHGILNHPLDEINARNDEADSNTNPKELQANVFSRDILAPACVLEAIGVKTSIDIVRLCDISVQSAEIRFERMEILRKRNVFFESSLEKQVYEQFKPFIDEMKSRGGEGYSGLGKFDKY